MTKQHFEAFAAVIAEQLRIGQLNKTQARLTAEVITEVAARYNPRFDSDRFHKAAGTDQ